MKLPDDPNMLSLVITWNNGEGELTVSDDHPLVAHLRVATTQGKPPGDWKYLLIDADSWTAPKVLGTFVFTEGARLLFFPGATIFVEDSNGSTSFSEARVDHITLDFLRSVNNKYSSHIAVYKKDDSRGLSYKIRPPAGYMVPWFSMIAPTLSSFTPLPARLTVPFSQLRPDLKKFANELFPNSNHAYARVSPPEQPNCFFQLDTWVAWGHECRQYKSKPLPWAYKSELVSDTTPGEQKVNVYIIDLEFSDLLLIRCYCLFPTGRVDEAHILRPTLKY